MVVGKKYRGNMAKCVDNYIRERLENPDALEMDEIFVTHTPISDEIIDLAKSTVKECASFKTMYESTAGCTVSCHCGEGVLGILYVRKEAKTK